MGINNFQRGGAALRDTLQLPVRKTAGPIVMLFGLWAQTGPRNHELDGGSDRSHVKG